MTSFYYKTNDLDTQIHVCIRPMLDVRGQHQCWIMINVGVVPWIYGPGNVVGIATGYGWTVRGSNPGGGEIFRTCPDRPWGPPSLMYIRYRVFPGVKERPGRDAGPSPPSSARGHERVEVYLYSPYGPYGLYRASVPVQGCILPLLLPLKMVVGCRNV